MVGVGVDLVDVARFTAVLARTPRLAERVFTDLEITMSGGPTPRPASLAARWAAKEAVVKVLVDGRGLAWHDCEVLSGERGQPSLRMTGTVLAAATARGIDAWHVTLSHDGGMAIAFVLATGREPPVIGIHDIARVRAAEEAAFRVVPTGALMQRAAFALSVACARLLRGARGAVVGSRVVLLVGSGNNGGDALWAGAMLARRGCHVDALALADTVHAEGAAALQRAGGRMHRWADGDERLADLVDRADLAVDGILGIGGSGALKADAASLVGLVAGSGAIVVAVDVPSGVDADSGLVTGACVAADVTVTFGALKPGLVVAPGSLRSGAVQLVDIGLEFDGPAVARIIEGLDVASWVAEPAPDAYKYRRGVVAVSAGSAQYPGAALLATSAARHGNAGMVRFLDRADGTAASVVSRYPDVVVDGSEPIGQPRVDAWACGPGFPGDQTDALTVAAVLATDLPVVLDAGALTVVAESPQVRHRIAERAEQGLVTVHHAARGRVRANAAGSAGPLRWPPRRHGDGGRAAGSRRRAQGPGHDHRRALGRRLRRCRGDRRPRGRGVGRRPDRAAGRDSRGRLGRGPSRSRRTRRGGSRRGMAARSGRPSRGRAGARDVDRSQ